MGDLYILFEHAAGYALFKVKEFEEIGMLLPQVESSVTDLSRFNQVVKLVGFSPFKSGALALENINSISEGIAPENLILFLDTYLPKSKKKSKITLGVAEPKIGAAITETLGVSCNFQGVVPEILRGIRTHFANLIKGFATKASATSQLGLGHSYSRAKVKFNVNRVDNNVIQSISLLDLLNKNTNTFAMRIREWYSYHFPELIKIVPESNLYIKLVIFIKNRKELTQDKLDELEEIIMDRAKAQAIIDAARTSMGMDISPIDLINIEMFANNVSELFDYKKEQQNYLGNKMDSVAPNLATLVGDEVGARLIAHAGSLVNLAKYPASTVQILGAEKALFRALKTRGNTPKYGLLFHSTFIGKAGNKNKGRISRYLANKCSIASRIDCFLENPTKVFGEKLKQQVEDRLKYYDSGEIPKKNIDVMKEAIDEAALIQIEPEKKKKKKKKRKISELENGEVNETDLSISINNASESEEPKKKKKKKKNSESETQETNISSENIEVNGGEVRTKKKKKKKSITNDE